MKSMASSAATRHPLTFFNLCYLPPQAILKAPLLQPTFLMHRFKPISTTAAAPIKSLDVSNEDNPLSPISQEEIEKIEDRVPIDRRRLEEKFAVVNTGIYECRSCGYKYDERVGDSSYPIPPGLPFAKVPDDWRCPTCGASQSFFESKSKEIAGFAQNQQFGLGGNALTSGQKALLIYAFSMYTHTCHLVFMRERISFYTSMPRMMITMGGN